MRNTVVVPIQKRTLSDYTSRANELLAMSESILEAAQRGDWGAALTRQRERSAELESFFAVGDKRITQDVAELIAGCIKKMLETDARVTALAYSSRESLEQEARLANRQGQAARAYLGHL